MGKIRIESDGASEMSSVYEWLSSHRGQVVPLGREKTVTLGVPISGARAVIIAAVLNNGVGGVFRALSSLTGSVRFVFDVRSRGGLDPDQVRVVGGETLDAIARQIAEDAVAQVA